MKKFSESMRFEAVKKISEASFKVRDLGKISRVDTISPPSVFIGSKLRYPMVNVGILSPLQRDENAWLYDDEKFWAENDFQMGEVIKLRDSLLNSRFRSQVQDSRLNKKFVEIAKQVAIAANPVDVEIELKTGINFKRSGDRVVTSQGLKAPLKKATILSNVKVHRKLDKMINDDLKASEALRYLSKNRFDEYSLNKILSVGVLGMKKNRKLVPTRWSITATDDTLGKQIIERVRDYKWIENFELFHGEFMGNQYIVFLFPNVWSYELFELYEPGSSWNPSSEMKASTDHEFFEGRKNYASNTVGGYYASRLPILKYLDSIKRQASVLVVRIETASYWAALGVWVVRESVKKALKNKMVFDSREELISSGKKVSQIKYNFDNSGILARSKVLEMIKTQRRLGEWF